MKKYDILVGLAFVAVFFQYCAGSNAYLGCYHDDDANLDLDNSEIIFAEGGLTVPECVWQCRESGWPYAGLRRARTCYCGDRYGLHGEGDAPIDCNYTCGGRFCGGNEANSVYYTIDSEDDTDRQLFAHGGVATFLSARTTCISSNGDLVTSRNYGSMDDVAALFADFDLTANYFWLGLRDRCGLRYCEDTDLECSDFAWVDENNDQFNCTAHSNDWVAVENYQNDCVIVNMTSGKWETTSCYAQYPFLCFSTEQGGEDEDVNADEEITVQEDEVDNSSTRTALFIVLPFFFFCYGGSCLLYCIHKAYKSCRRRRRKHMLLERQDSFAEFEPETKPRKKSMIVVGKKNHGFADGPADESQPEPVLGKKESSLSLTSSRPTTSDAVRLDMNSPPGSADTDQVPGYYKKNKMKDKINKMRAERRRAKLLENALMEARQRRATKENSTLGDENETPKKADGGAGSSPNAEDGLAGSRWGRINRYTQSSSLASPKSGDENESKSESKASLLDDDRKTESPDDPTMMSIADIMRVKMMMKEKKKKVRKILLS